MADAAPFCPLSTPPGRPAGSRRHAAWRWSRRLSALAIALVAALILSFFTVDLGRFTALRTLAEQGASGYLKRPMHIGRIEVRPGRGQYVLHDVVIEGLHGGPAFFRAGLITVRMSWRTLLQRQVVLDIRVRDWAMTIEKWDDRHNIPHLGAGQQRESRAPRPVTFRTVSHADRGTFTFTDHAAPWSVVAPNLSFDMVWSLVEQKYVGRASFEGGTVRIRDSLPMGVDMTTRFSLVGSAVSLPHIDLRTDGAVTHLTGQLDFSRWPEQSYTINSTLDFRRMREIFFHDETWDVTGRGRFTGTFNLYKDERGRDLTGEFSSDLATVNGLRFPKLHGALEWLPHRFAVTHADADVLGGRARFAYAIEPLGTDEGSTQKFVADVDRVQLADLRELVEWPGLELAGVARGRVAMAWPSGRFSRGVTGEGAISAAPPPGVTLATADLPARVAIGPPSATGPFDPKQPLGTLPVGGDVAFRFDPEGMTFSETRLATPSTFVSLTGRRTYDGQARFPFFVASRDWQASDRLLAAIMTAAGAPTDAIEVGGVGTFDGVMTGTFSAPRIEGRFSGEEIRAWGVTWGRGTGLVTIEDRYLDLREGVIERGDGTIRSEGRFALGIPRKDGGEEIRTRVGVRSWPLDDLKMAFGQQDWPIDGTIASSDLTLEGKYDNALFGSGPLRIVRGVAWDERFDAAEGTLTFKGSIVEVSDMRIAKGAGTLTGSAVMGWDGTYVFDAVGERIPVESLDNFRFERAPLTGVLAVRASGRGRFDAPAYRVHAEAPDFAIGDQGVGLVRGDLTLSGNVLTIERLQADSNRLTFSGRGRIVLNDTYDTTFEATFENSLLDPYIKILSPEWSDLNRVVVYGSARARGPLKTPEQMNLAVAIDQGTLSLFDYELRNAGRIEFGIDRQHLTIGRFVLTGRDTTLEVTGGLSTADSSVDLSVSGRANLAILQSPSIQSAGTADLTARLTGTFERLSLAGRARIDGGSLRYSTLPSLTDIAGTVTFDDQGINAAGLTARMGGGPVRFGGYVGLDLTARRFTDYHLTASGRRMLLRYPEGFQSRVDADLDLSGPVTTPRLAGVVRVLSAHYVKRIDTDAAGFLGLAGGGAAATPLPVESGDDRYRLTYDVQIIADPSTLRIEGPGTRIAGSGELFYRGPADRTSLTGFIQIDQGQVLWNGNRFNVRNGSIKFTNPTRIEPEFDVTATTRPRAPGQTFDVTIRIAGTTSRLDLSLNSDPWLSQPDIIRLLFGEAPDPGTAAEQRALRSSAETGVLFQTAAAQLLVSPISSRVGSAFGELPGAPIVTIAPVIGTEITSSATARVIVGKQISSRAYLSYTRTLNSSNSNEFILLEFEQSDRLSWILSRNEDRTFALDFRIRHVF